jgi:predicted metal-dependent phosphoesterase TrpH
MVDLHTHSTCSDGSLTPSELVRAAAQAGVTALALTDHDTVAGNAEFLEAARAAGLEGVPGVEISAESGPRTMHILGFFVEPDAALDAALGRLREGRARRNAEILEALSRLGLPLDAAELAAAAGGASAVGRPHIADAMVRRGYVRDRSAAFDRYLARGKPAYRERFRFSPGDSIAAIRGAGGVAALAHPGSLQLPLGKLTTAVDELVAAGLGGIEAHHPDHNAARRRQYEDLARGRGLAVTGGSDFHGGPVSATKLGAGYGDLRVPADAVEQLRARAGRR